MTYYTTDADGVTELNPTRAAYSALIHSTLGSDEPVGDVWMTHAPSGLTVTLFPNGTLAAESFASGTERKQLGPVDAATALRIWDALAAGDIASVLSHNWRDAV